MLTGSPGLLRDDEISPSRKSGTESTTGGTSFWACTPNDKNEACREPAEQPGRECGAQHRRKTNAEGTVAETDSGEGGRARPGASRTSRGTLQAPKRPAIGAR